MKTKVLPLLILLVIAASCSSNKQAQLDKLKKEQKAISDKISSIEKKLIAGGDSSNMNTNATLVAVTPLQSSTFNHYIEVFGKLDGDQNIGVGAKMSGTVDEVLVKVGDKVTKDQVLVKMENQ